MSIMNSPGTANPKSVPMRGMSLLTDDDLEQQADFFSAASISAALTFNGKMGWGIINGTVLLFFDKEPKPTDEAELMYNFERVDFKEDGHSITLTCDNEAPVQLEAEDPSQLQQWSSVIRQQMQEASTTVLTPEQETILQGFKFRLAKDNPEIGDEPSRRVELIRFLKSKRWNEEDTLALYTDYLRWRKDFGVDKLQMKDVVKEFLTGKVEIPGTTDKSGRPIIIFRPRCHEPSESTPYSLIEMGAYIFDRVLETTPEQQITVIVDMAGLKKDHLDLRLPKTMFEILTYRYPNTVGLYCIVNQPLFFKPLYGLISSWLDKDMKQRIQLIGDKTEKLLSFISHTNLPIELGGYFEVNFRDWIRNRYKTEGWNFEQEVKYEPSFIAQTLPERMKYALTNEPSAEIVLPGCRKSGYMYKEGGWLKRFVKWFFVLEGNILFVYKSEKSKKPDGIIGLGNVKLESRLGVIKKQHNFMIVSTLKTYLFYVDTAEERTEWMDALEKEIIVHK